MSHIKARECFEENLRKTESLVANSAEWNLYTGLIALSKAIEKDQKDLKHLLTEVLQEVRKLR